ncbi:MAG: redoxin domain-containing protein, partial [Candidatus Kariarchaeaceae archaeon]
TEIIGVSVDNETKIHKFKQDCGLEFPLISDKNKKISKSFGVYRNRIVVRYAERVTFIIGNDNQIEKIFANGFLNEDEGVLVDNYANSIEKELGVSLLNEKLFSKLKT